MCVDCSGTGKAPDADGNQVTCQTCKGTGKATTTNPSLEAFTEAFGEPEEKEENPGDLSTPNTGTTPVPKARSDSPSASMPDPATSSA